MKFSANESLFVEMNFYISYRIEKQSVRRRSDFEALQNVIELTQNMRKPSYWSCPSNKKILVAASCSRAQAEYEELNHIDQWNEITANDNSNEEKSTIKVILVAARNVMTKKTSANKLKFFCCLGWFGFELSHSRLWSTWSKELRSCSEKFTSDNITINQNWDAKSQPFKSHRPGLRRHQSQRKPSQSQAWPTAS